MTVSISRHLAVHTSAPRCPPTELLCTFLYACRYINIPPRARDLLLICLRETLKHRASRTGTRNLTAVSVARHRSWRQSRHSATAWSENRPLHMSMHTSVTCLRTSLHTCLYTRLHMSICTSIYMHVCTHGYANTYAHANANAYARGYMGAYTYAYAQV